MFKYKVNTKQLLFLHHPTPYHVIWYKMEKVR